MVDSLVASDVKRNNNKYGFCADMDEPRLSQCHDEDLCAEVCRVDTILCGQPTDPAWFRPRPCARR